MRIPPQRVATIAIMVLFLALVRTLGEIYRLHRAHGPGFALTDALPYVGGAMIAAVGAWIAVGLHIWKRYRLTTAVVGATILTMLVYKVVVIGL